MTLADRVKKLRIEKGLTQQELGVLVGGIPYQSIQNLESGKVSNPRYMLELARALDVSVDYLLKGIVPAAQEDCVPMETGSLLSIKENLNGINSKRFYVVSVDKDKSLALSGDVHIEGEVLEVYESKK